MTVEKKINPKMLMLAREARGLTQMELADMAGINRSNISRFEQEFLGFTEEVMANLIKALGFPESFYLQDSAILPPALYRKRDKVPGKMLTQIDAHINICRLNIGKLLEAMKTTVPDLPSYSVSALSSATEIAIKVRKLWKVPKGAIHNLIQLLEEQGIITLSMDFKTERVDSRSFLIEGKYPVICYNKSLLGDRLRFTLAYELGHLLMHTRQVLPSMEGVGHEANLFAAEFLMPEKDIKSAFKDGVNLDVLANLKKQWKVSMQALLYRACDLEMLSDNQKRYIIGQFNALKIRRREPIELDVPIEKGQLLRDMITRYRTKQKMSVKQMAAFFCLSQEEFLNRYSN